MDKLIVSEQLIQNKIYTVRGLQVMLDSDLASLYQVETRIFNQAVKRNIKRFPESFRFQLTENEYKNLTSQFVTSSLSAHGGRRHLPYVFTEQGVSMLSAVLRSDVAIEMSIKIIEAFVAMRRLIASNTLICERFERIEQRLSRHDGNFDILFKALEDKSLEPSQGIFFDGQIFDAYEFVAGLIKSAKKEIILIDNYIDESVLTLFSKNQTVDVTIYTKTISKQLKLDLQKYNAQYRPITVKLFSDAHDRFMVIDEQELYHIGASLKDLGKKWFAFSRMESLEILGRLK
jgi:hypothetical protein